MKHHKLNEHLRTIDTITHCKKCNKVYKDSQLLKRHVSRSHAPVVVSKCGICCKQFDNTMRLQQHVNTVHVEPRFECDICSKLFRTRKHMSHHIKTVHSKVANYICFRCGERFKYQSTWKTHESKTCPRITGVKTKLNRYSCSLCNQKMTILSYGRLHYRNVHKVKDVSNVCVICNHLSESKEELLKHMNLMHADLVCPICKRFYKEKLILKTHMETHSSKERPFECPVRY